MWVGVDRDGDGGGQVEGPESRAESGLSSIDESTGLGLW